MDVYAEENERQKVLEILEVNALYIYQPTLLRPRSRCKAGNNYKTYILYTYIQYFLTI